MEYTGQQERFFEEEFWNTRWRTPHVSAALSLSYTAAVSEPKVGPNSYSIDIVSGRR